MIRIDLCKGLLRFRDGLCFHVPKKVVLYIYETWMLLCSTHPITYAALHKRDSPKQVKDFHTNDLIMQTLYITHASAIAPGTEMSPLVDLERLWDHSLDDHATL